MKKVLLVILAIMMIAATVPMAFAAECEHVYDAETLVRPNVLKDGYYVCPVCQEEVTLKRADYTEFDEAYVYVTACDYHIYDSHESTYAAARIVDGIYNELFELADKYPEISQSIDSSLYNLYNAEQEILDEFTSVLISGVEKIKKAIADGEFTIVFEGTEAAIANYELNLIAACYTDEEFNAAYGKITTENLTKFEEISNDYFDLCAKTEEDPTSVTQQEFYEKQEAFVNVMRTILRCISGTHSFEVAVDNGNGTHTADCLICVEKGIIEEHTWGEYTENADGSKTAKCTECEATDTIAPEIPDEGEAGGDTDDDEEVKSGFAESVAQLIFDFIELLKKLFASLFA